MFLDESSLIKDLSQGLRTDPFRKRSKSFSVGQPRTLCAYFAHIFSVLYTVSVLIFHPECFSSFTITPCHAIDPYHAQNFAQACLKFNCDLHLNEAKNEAETRVITH